MKTVEQIIEKIKNGGFKHDIFGFSQGDLLGALPYDSAKVFLKEEYQNDAETEKIGNI